MSKIVIFSGAGISAESGIPTFRDADGLWEGHKIEEVCTLSTWLDNYDAVHKFYDERRRLMAGIQPNAAHHLIADWSKRFEVINITQNIDDLFERAGCENVIHLHGRLSEMRCRHCDMIWDIGHTGSDTAVCPDQHTHAPHREMKPNVVFFGEEAPYYRDLYNTVYDLKDDDIVFVIGTSDAVVPFSHILTGMKGRKFRINPTPEISRVYEEDINLKATEAIADMESIVNHYLVKA